MRESEFDKYVKDLLYNAQEEVSPRVWDGVAAGLPAKRRIIPFWGWASGAVAAAAAVVAAVVLFRSTPAPVSPSFLSLPAPVAVIDTPVEVRDLPVAPERKTVAVTSVGNPSVFEVIGSALKPIRNRAQGVNPVLCVPEPQAPGQMLAYFEETPEKKPLGLSLVLDGHFQGNQRGEVGSGGYRRAFSAPPVGAGEGIYNETPETNFRLPFSIGLGVRYNLTSRWALGTGIRYTNLGRTFVADFVSRDGIIVPQTDIDNHQHWFGIPLNVYYDIVNTGRWRVHAFAGGAAEFLLSNSFLIHYSPKDLHYESRGTTPQWSAAGGLGVEFRLAPRLGLYIDPHFRYYFDAAQQPRSLRTIQPLRFDIEAGVRFSFGEN